ncbi:MAG: ATP-binding cassette domain-containing protein [Rhodobacteraceae bacterium]|nr:ATP-binding cassette domain-containing protein [Paracoccaceae bacterium]
MQRARARIIAPVAGVLNRAGALSVLAGLLWPVQAGVLAGAIAAWVADPGDLRPTLLAALLFLALALLRAGLEHRAGALLFAAADRVIAAERAAILGREARQRAGMGSAALAALTVQKLALLQPWITRYQVAMLRVAVLPPVLLVLAFWHSWVVGLTLLVAGPLIPVFMALVGMAAEEASRRQLGEIASINDMLMERLAALTDIRLLGASDHATADFAARAEALRLRSMGVLRIAFLSSTVLELFAALGVALVAVFVGFTLLGEIGFGSWGGRLSLGQGIFLLLLAPEFFQPLRDMAAAWHDRAAGLTVVEELEALDRAARSELVGQGGRAPALPGPLRLEVRGAVAQLPGRVLALPDLALGPGARLAITGPSGVGKSTTLAAIAGLLPLAGGRIEVCGRTLDGATADGWRARIAWMPQRVHFPDMALADWLGASAGRGEELRAALAQAGAAAVVEGLPEGLETRLGASGSGVSGGEARRLMLARAILAGGDLLLADEPTADLDTETAERVIAALLRLNAGGRALLVATHDPRLARAMGQVVEMTA